MYMLNGAKNPFMKLEIDDIDFIHHSVTYLKLE